MIELALSLGDIALAAALVGGLALLAHAWHRLAVDTESGRAAVLSRSLTTARKRLAAERARAEAAEKKAARSNALADRLRGAEAMVAQQAEQIADLNEEASRYALLVYNTLEDYDFTTDEWAFATQAQIDRKAMERVTLADVRDCAAYGREALADIAKALNATPAPAPTTKGKRPGGR